MLLPSTYTKWKTSGFSVHIFADLNFISKQRCSDSTSRFNNLQSAEDVSVCIYKKKVNLVFSY